jgi:hypothetical protein
MLVSERLPLRAVLLVDHLLHGLRTLLDDDDVGIEVDRVDGPLEIGRSTSHCPVRPTLGLEVERKAVDVAVEGMGVRDDVFAEVDAPGTQAGQEGPNVTICWKAMCPRRR